MKTLLNFIANRGFTIMICGLLTTISGIIAYVILDTPRFAGSPYIKAAFALTITGLAIYVIGRISLAIQRRRNPPPARRP
ncbi:MAG: hypothetical protein LBI42_08735 [Chitinispirillales bacterium]|jgi:hypothetical protein|nr:hypothetical protein [Chitinispirillales bacterium]